MLLLCLFTFPCGFAVAALTLFVFRCELITLLGLAVYGCLVLF